MRGIALTAAVVLGLAACGKGGAPTTDAAFEAVKKAAAAKDWGALYACFPPSYRKEAEANWEQAKKQMQAQMPFAMPGMGNPADMSFKDMFTMMMGMMGSLPGTKFAEIKSAVIVDKNIEGKKCTLKVKAGAWEDALQVVQEDGRWYLGGEEAPTKKEQQ